MAKATKPVEGAQFVRYFGPLLDALRDLGGSGAKSEVVEQIARDLNIPEQVQNELLESGAPRFQNQVAWARFYLSREGLIESSRRGIWSLTERGWNTRLTLAQARAIFLRWVRIFAEERKRKKAQVAEVETEEQAPEKVESAISFRERIVQILLALPASGFERLCQRLLREAGFIEVNVTGRSGDGGIDGHGTLQINPLVSFKVLFQCKRFSSSVSPSHIRDFRGAMQGRADKGIIITTGVFTSEARRESTRDGAPPIELVDGSKLVDMFTELELGVKQVVAYEVDESFFSEFSAT